MPRLILFLCLSLFFTFSSCSDDDSPGVPNDCMSIVNDLQEEIEITGTVVDEVEVRYGSSGPFTYDGPIVINECTLRVSGRLFNLLEVQSFVVYASGTLSLRYP